MPDSLAPTPPVVPVLPVAGSPEAVPTAVDSPDGHRSRPGTGQWFAVTAVVLLAAYLLLENPYWVPGGDSDFYVAVARSMARHQGFSFNGLPVTISPPGWPWAMAQVMKLSPTFLALKLLTLLCMYGSLLIAYFVNLRFLPSRLAAWSVILAGLLMPVYSLTYFTHSEGLYCLAAAAALLLALRVREGRGGLAHVVGLVLLCCCVPLIRWAGLLQILPVVAVLLSAVPGTPLVRRHWKTAAACFVMLATTWGVAHHFARLSPEQLQQANDTYGAPSSDADVAEEDIKRPDIAGVKLLGAAGSGKHGFVVEYGGRMLRSGKWFSWLLWQPSRFMSVSKAADVLVTLVGWGVIGLCGFLAVIELRRGELLWASLVVYCGGLCLGWDNPNSRYLVPVAPLITAGLLVAIQRGRELWPATGFDGWKWLRRGLIYSVLAVNVLMYAVDVIVMRSSRFYSTFEAGQHKDLINIACYLMSLPKEPHGLTSMPYGAQFRPEDGDVMVNERYENLGRVRYSQASSRAMTLLTDRYVKPLEYGKMSQQTTPPLSLKLGNTMRRRNTEWLLIQAPAVPWRLWHFRVPQFVFERMTKDHAAPPSGGWTLYHFVRTDRSFTPQPVPGVENWPTRVPGL